MAADTVRARFVPLREAMREAQARERAALKDRHGRLRTRLLRVLDLTGTTRRRQDAARKLLAAEHRQARHELSGRYRAARAEAERSVRARHSAAVDTAMRERKGQAAAFERRRKELDRRADVLLQQREIEREHMRRITEGKVEAWQKQRKDGGSLGVESGFAKAMKRAAEQEKRQGPGRGKGDFERER